MRRDAAARPSAPGRARDTCRARQAERATFAPSGGCYAPSVSPASPGDRRLTDAQRDLRDAIRTLATERVAPRAAEIDRSGEFPEDIRRLLADQGILSLPYPERHGGLAADLLTVCLAIEALSRACATTGLILAVQELASLPLLMAGSAEQQDRWFPDLAAGRTLIAFGLTEAEAGSDAASIRTRAVRDGDGWVIDGGKRFITHGSVADLVTVFAVSEPDTERHARLSCFIVPTDSPGFRVVRLEHKMGIRGSPTAELAFDGVRVPADHLVGARGEGFSLAMRTLDRSRPGIAAQAVGIAQGALDVAVAYAGERRQFGRPIGDFQLIQGLLADMDAATESARQLLYTACDAIDAGAPDASRWSALAKLVAGDAAMRVTSDAVQVLGGYGYVDDYPVERMMRDAKITQLYEGTQQIQRLVVARALLGRAG